MSREEMLVEIMIIAYELQAVVMVEQCPRAISSAVLLNAGLSPIATGRNLLPLGEGPCSCNSGVDTFKTSCKTCRAEHAEQAALEYIRGTANYGNEAYMVTTRPPCKVCLEAIQASNVHTIITTDQFPDRDDSERKWQGTWVTLEFEEFKQYAPLCHNDK